MKLLAKCETCHKRRFIIKRRKVKMPTQQLALSQKLMCSPCYETVLNMLKTNA